MKLLKLGSVFCFLLFCCFGAVDGVPFARADVDADRTATEAPAAFDGETNGACLQDEFEAVEDTFAEKEHVDDGIGPVYNAVSCGDCHENPVMGGNSQVFEVRAGHFANGVFTDQVGGRNDQPLEDCGART